MKFFFQYVVLVFAAVLLSMCMQQSVATFEDYYDLEYDYSFSWSGADCTTDSSGNNILNGTACSLKVEGEDTIETLPGGVTGTYKYVGCQSGRPYYKRDASDMWIIYSTYWGDWDFSNSSKLIDANVLGYGGQGFGESRPEGVLSGKWYILKDLLSHSDSEDDFVNAPLLKVNCIMEVREGKDAGSCTDVIMNGDEEGVDCGGSLCVPCVRVANQQDAIKALKEKPLKASI